jgi:cyclin B
LIWVLIWWFRKFAASLASKGEPELQVTTTDPGLGDDHNKEPIDDGTVYIDVEQYEPVPDVDIDMVFALC